MILGVCTPASPCWSVDLLAVRALPRAAGRLEGERLDVGVPMTAAAADLLVVGHATGVAGIRLVRHE